jgi:hypothetical protein
MRAFIRLLPLLCGAFMTAASAADGAATMTYIHLYADAAGVSHFKERKLTFNPLNDPNRPAALTNIPLPGANGATFLRLHAGANEDWHVAPRRWFLIAIQGESEVIAADGEKRRLRPGMIMLMDDTTGKGHQTRALGKEDHVALVIPVTDIPPEK